MMIRKSATTVASLTVVALAIAVAIALAVPVATAFSGVFFKDAVAQRRSTPSKTAGVDIELPDFHELFDRIQQVSPLARQVQSSNTQRGFAHLADANNNKWTDNLPWKTVEKNPRNAVHHIEKIDNFDGKPAPLLRFRSSFTGPCVGECFANFVMNLEERKKWDTQIANVTEIYPVHDLDSANIAMGFGRYGDCARLGVGYCQTKAGFGVSPREQLTLCGIQEFADSGSCVIWGTEMAERNNYLFPADTVRHTRAKSHIFSTTLTPTSDTTFDIEYVLQMEIGGNIPTWLTTPVVIDSVKNLFRTTQAFFADNGEGSGLDRFLNEKAAQAQLNFANYQGLLMTP